MDYILVDDEEEITPLKRFKRSSNESLVIPLPSESESLSSKPPSVLVKPLVKPKRVEKRKSIDNKKIDSKLCDTSKKQSSLSSYFKTPNKKEKALNGKKMDASLKPGIMDNLCPICGCRLNNLDEPAIQYHVNQCLNEKHSRKVSSEQSLITESNFSNSHPDVVKTDSISSDLLINDTGNENFETQNEVFSNQETIHLAPISETNDENEIYKTQNEFCSNPEKISAIPILETKNENEIYRTQHNILETHSEELFSDIEEVNENEIMKIKKSRETISNSRETISIPLKVNKQNPNQVRTSIKCKGNIEANFDASILNKVMDNSDISEDKVVEKSDNSEDEIIITNVNKTTEKTKSQSNIGNFFKSNNANQPTKVKVPPTNKPLTSKPLTSKPLTSKPSVGNKFKRNQPAKQCPFYKKIPGTSITIDAFRYGEIAGCTCYFLSHFHADHYGGLTKKFQGTIYCSKVTGNLVISQLGIDSSRVINLPMNKPIKVNDVMVTLLDANHCPGAVMFYLELSNKQRILHVGDFRADESMMTSTNSILQNHRLNTIYLDTTYCNSKYSFPLQKDTIAHVRKFVKSFLQSRPRTLICVGTYTIGKERVFEAISEELKINKIAVSKNKLKVLKCLEDEGLGTKLTVDYNETNLHVIPMAWLNIKKLNDHFTIYNKESKYEHLLAIKPTGWTFTNNTNSLDDIKPQTKGGISIYGLPYSEHSSFKELEWFIRTLKPYKIIPTVNIGSKPLRDQMQIYFNQWLSSS